MEVILFGFVCFLYYKILSSFMFSVSISVLACLLSAIFSVTIVVLIGLLLFPKIRSVSLEAIRRQTNEKFDIVGFAIENCVAIFGLAIVGFAVANSVVGFLITHGFSTEFTREVLRGPFSRLSSSGLISFAIVFSTPGVFFYLPQAIRTYRALSNRP